MPPQDPNQPQVFQPGQQPQPIAPPVPPQPQPQVLQPQMQPAQPAPEQPVQIIQPTTQQPPTEQPPAPAAVYQTPGLAPVPPVAPGYPAQQVAAPQQGSNALAIIGLVLAFLFTPAGLVVSITALKKHKNSTSKILSIIGIVVSVISILVAGLILLLILASVPALQNNAKNVKEQTDLQTLQSNIESSFSTTGSYPSLSQINDPNWRTQNMKDVSPETFSPNGSILQLVSGSPTNDAYAYTPSPDGCDASQANPCKSYVLSAKESGGQLYTIPSLNQ